MQHGRGSQCLGFSQPSAPSPGVPLLVFSIVHRARDLISLLSTSFILQHPGPGAQEGVPHGDGRKSDLGPHGSCWDFGLPAKLPAPLSSPGPALACCLLWAQPLCFHVSLPLQSPPLWAPSKAVMFLCRWPGEDVEATLVHPHRQLPVLLRVHHGAPSHSEECGVGGGLYLPCGGTCAQGSGPTHTQELGLLPFRGAQGCRVEASAGPLCPLGESGLAEAAGGCGVLELGLLVPWREATGWAVLLLNCRTRSPVASFPWRI